LSQAGLSTCPGRDLPGQPDGLLRTALPGKTEGPGPGDDHGPAASLRPAPPQEPDISQSPQQRAAVLAGLGCPEAAGPVDARTGLTAADLLTGLPRLADPRMTTAADPDDPGSLGWRAYWRAQHAQAEADRPVRQREARDKRLEGIEAAVAGLREELAGAGTGAKS
jgi:hypothetical protein